MAPAKAMLVFEIMEADRGVVCWGCGAASGDVGTFLGLFLFCLDRDLLLDWEFGPLFRAGDAELCFCGVCGDAWKREASTIAASFSEA